MGTRVLRAGAVAAALLAVSACQGDGPTPTSTSQSPSSSSAAPAEPAAPTASDQPELGGQEAVRALPPASSLPKDSKGDGWVDNDVTPGGQFTYEPAECADLYLQGPAGKAFADEHRTVTAKGNYATDGLDSEYLTVFLYSHDEPVPAELFTTAGERMGTCGTFTQISGSGTRTDETLIGLQVREVGDQQLAFATTSESMSRFNRLMVRSGHNVVVVNYVGERHDASTLLHETARLTLERTAR